MKILIISPTQKGIGGVAKVVQGLKNFLVKNGNEVDIISSENTLTIPIKGLKNPSFIVSSFLKTRFGKKYDVVHAHNPPSAIAMKNISGKKILSIWGVYATQVKTLHGKTISKLSKKLEKKALEAADAITVASKEIQEYYSKLGYQTYYIPNAIELDSLPQNIDRRYDKQIIYAGRLSKEKGILDLLQICAKLPSDIHLIILGNGPEEKKTRQIANKKNNIHYLGFQPKEKTIPLIRGSDILVQPSLMEGGVNTTLLEAMACKTPILSTSLDVYKDTIRHMDTGYCINPNSPNEILDAVLELSNNRELRTKLTENAYREVFQHSWDVIGKKYLELYKKIM